VEKHLPKEFLMEIELNENQKETLLNQIDRFNRIKLNGFEEHEPIINQSEEIMLKEGMIIHGIDSFNYDKLLSIKNTGILTGQAIGIEEDGETYFCADFHRVDKDISFYEYSMNFPYRDGRCPMGKYNIGSNSLAFIIDRNSQENELFKYDCYKEGTPESEITKSFINYMPMEKELASSILYGVPSNLIEGIIIGNKLMQDKKIVDFIIENFPNCYLIGKFGDLVYNPKDKEFNSEKYIESRREIICLKNEKKELESLLKYKEKELKELEEKYRKINSSIINNCDNLTLYNIFTEIGSVQMAKHYMENNENTQSHFR